MALGNDALRARIARLYGEWYGVAVAPERIAVTAGSSAAFVLAFLAVFDAGDAVALPSPGYPCYRHILSALGQRSVLLETGPATRMDADGGGRRARRPPRRHQGAADRQPRQSDRHDDLRRSAWTSWSPRAASMACV